MNIAYLLIGGNLGDRYAYLQQARFQIANTCGKINQTSAIYESEPWGNKNQPGYLNQAIELHTMLDAHNLLDYTRAIENNLDRKRDGIYAPRTMDIDILYFNNELINDADLIIPHPRISERKFVLVPMNEIAEKHIDPVLKMTVSDLLSHCQDNSAVSPAAADVDNKDR